jgi:hypothetical protein
MSKADLSNVLIDAGGGVRRKQTAPPPVPPSPVQDLPDAMAPSQRGRAGTSPITVHFPTEVRDQLKIMAIEQRTTMQQLIGEAFNDLFAKYGKPEIAPADQAGA